MNKRVAKLKLGINNLSVEELNKTTQADKNTHFLEVSFDDTITTDGYSLLVLFKFPYPSKEVVVEEIETIVRENQQVILPNVCLKASGKLNIEFALKKDEELITINKSLAIEVIRTINGTYFSAVAGEELQKTIDEQVAEIKELLDGAEEVLNEVITNYIEENSEKLRGPQGKSAYQIAVEDGFVGSEEEWLESLKGQDGRDGVNGTNGIDGQNGQDGEDGIDGVTFIPAVSPEGIISWSNNGNLPNPSPINIKGRDGEDGLDGIDAEISNVSAIVDDTSENPQVNVELGGTPSDRTITFKFTGINGRNGQNGENGKDGNPGRDGIDGKSAEITSVTAKANSVQGQPTVEVIEGGTNLAKTLQFIFGIPTNSEGGSGGTTITDVVVNVDDGVGTPSGTASIDGTTLTLNFSNLKGSQGNDGKQGIPGQDGKDGTTIESVVVNVDNNVGIPSGTASISGKELTLILKNLKGEQGKKGDTGNQGERGPQGPAWTGGEVENITVNGTFILNGYTVTIEG